MTFSLLTSLFLEWGPVTGDFVVLTPGLTISREGIMAVQGESISSWRLLGKSRQRLWQPVLVTHQEPGWLHSSPGGLRMQLEWCFTEGGHRVIGNTSS